MRERFIREIALVGDEAFSRLANAHVLVVGVGGVGGYAVEVLARSGIGKLTLCDGDIVDVSNVNRQIIALSSTIGQFKCEAFQSRIFDINPHCNVTTLNIRYNTTTSEHILSQKFDYIIDAIDSIQDKVELIVNAHERGINIVSAMGAGNRYQLADFEINDISKTSYDPLARKLRKLLKERGISNTQVVYTKSECVKTTGVIGSISYLPPLSGVKLGGYVVNQILNIKE